MSRYAVWVVSTIASLGNIWVHRHDDLWGIILASLLGAGLGLCWGSVCFFEPPQRPIATTTPTRRLRSRCYLVVHLDLKVSPPTVLFVHTYSCSAKDLTHTGAREARTDLYMIEADTFQEALDEMRVVQPLYFPWATPYLTRNR